MGTKNLNKKKLFFIFTFLISMVCFQNCSRGSFDSGQPTPDQQGVSIKDCSATIDYKKFQNNVTFLFTKKGEIFLSAGNLENETNKYFFQIAVSKNQGRSWCLFPEDGYSMATATESENLLPREAIAHENRIFAFVDSQVSSVSNGTTTTVTRSWLYEGNITDNSWKKIELNGFGNCVLYNIFPIDNSFFLFGSCNSVGTLFKTDSQFANAVKLDSLDSPTDRGSRLSSLIKTANGCFYYAGMYWSTNQSGQFETVAAIRKSCDQGVTWITETSHRQSGQAYGYLNQLLELENEIIGVGQMAPQSGQAYSLPRILKKDSFGQWQFNVVPSAADPAFRSFSFKKVLKIDGCSLVGIVDEGGDSFSILRSSDCGSNWVIQQSFTRSKFNNAIVIDGQLKIGRSMWDEKGNAEANVLTVNL